MPKQQAIEENASIKFVLKRCSFDTLCAFDIDNTLVRPSNTNDVGSDQWFSMLISYAYKNIPDKKEALQLVLELNQYVQNIIKVEPVEDLSAEILKRLQDVGLPIIGLTARGMDISEATEKQLKTVGIQFSKPTDNVILDIGDPTRDVRYHNGVLYCDGANKGTCLNAFLELLEKKYSVVMVDDNGKNLHHILEAAKKGEYSFIGIRYSATDHQVQNFKQPEAMEKLHSWIDLKILPDRAREIIARFKIGNEGPDPKPQDQKL